MMAGENSGNRIVKKKLLLELSNWDLLYPGMKRKEVFQYSGTDTTERLICWDRRTWSQCCIDFFSLNTLPLSRKLINAVGGHV